MSIGIFPASGGLGGSTYSHLLQLVPNDQVVLISRDPKKVPQKYVQGGVILRQATYESSAEEFKAAFSGIKTLFLISYPSHVHEYRVKVQLPAIDAARQAGVTHIFYSSLAFAGLDKRTSLAEVMQAHLDTEKYLEKLAKQDPSFTFTSIREGLYSESTPIYTAFLLPNKIGDAHDVLIPHDGTGPGVSWVKRDELGEASARLIADYAAQPKAFEHINKIVTLTGTREWSLADTVEALAKVVGKKIQIKQVSVEEYVSLPQVLEKFGSKTNAVTWATAWDAIRAGEAGKVTSTLETILGRKPEDFETTIQHLWS